MTLPETTAPPTPILGYASAGATPLDPRALSRIRLGGWFLTTYTASTLVRWIFSVRQYLIFENPAVFALIGACFGFCLALAACLLAANTRHPFDRAVFRRLLLVTSLALAITVAVDTPAVYYSITRYSPLASRVLKVAGPLANTAYGTALCLSFLRLADLSRRFHTCAIARQCLVMAIFFLTLYTYYLSYQYLSDIGVNWVLSPAFNVLRTMFSLWAATLLTCLLPHLKSSPPNNPPLPF